MSSKKEKILIIDGNALIHRSFHALPPTMSNQAGEHTNAIYGFVSVFLKVIKELRPEYVVMALDRKESTFRHIKFTEYKAKRVKAPDELYEQIPKVKEVVEAFGVPVFDLAGFEADDLIGTIVNGLDSRVEKIILTGDNDAMQLVSEHTKVYTLSRGLSDGILYDAEKVKAKFGIGPDLIIDYKALRGDQSDNIPGVKGIGEKTAVELLTRFSSLDAIYENIESSDIKESVRQKLLDGRDSAFLSRELATIHQKAPISFSLDQARFGSFDLSLVSSLFKRFEFTSLASRLKDLLDGGLAEDTSKKQDIDKFARNQRDFKYHIIESERDFKSFAAQLKKQRVFAFDTETSGLDPLQCDLLGIGFSWQAGEAWYIDFRDMGRRSSAGQGGLFAQTMKSDREAWWQLLCEIFSDSLIGKVAFNAKFDCRVLRAQGAEVSGLCFDPMLASQLLDENVRQQNLDAVVFAEFGFEKISKVDLLGVAKNKISFSQVEPERLGIYCCEDADFTWRLFELLKSRLIERDLDKLYNKVELPLVLVLSEMEDNGISLKETSLDLLSRQLSKRLQELNDCIYQAAGRTFNINSTQQLAVILFEVLGLPTDGISKTKSGWSTAADELEKLVDKHLIVPLLQEYRELAKLQSTYIESLPKMINPQTGRIHTNYSQASTATGRLSSTDPNLQNIPIKNELGRAIRRAFVAPPGRCLLALDYSQIELRVAAHLSGDEIMHKIFNSGGDIHQATAAAINNISFDDVSSEMRREAKAVNFGVLYGQGPHGLAQGAGITFARAKEFIEAYFSKFSGVKSYIDSNLQAAREKGYVETMLGRRRYLPDLLSNNVQLRKAAERMAINTPIQGSAADIIKVAMVEISSMIKKDYPNGELLMLLQIHDELLFECDESLLNQAAEKIKKIMERAIKLSVSLLVEPKSGDNWGEMKKLDL